METKTCDCAVGDCDCAPPPSQTQSATLIKRKYGSIGSSLFQESLLSVDHGDLSHMMTEGRLRGLYRNSPQWGVPYCTGCDNWDEVHAALCCCGGRTGVSLGVIRK